ncbi:Modification methylase DsaV (M.DsaV) (Cytosine-specific methyltransferase DsaV), partial [Durusdinium trenchii]
MAPKQSKCAKQTEWSRMAPDLGQFARPLHVSLPCVGIDGAGFALTALKVPWTSNNVFDLEKRYQTHLEKHLCTKQIHLGKDINELELHHFERPVDLLVSGPPCPPWAGNGNHQGLRDQRADVFLAVVKLVISLVKVGELKACVLENVKGILSKPKGKEMSFMDYLVDYLRHHCPEFDWAVVTLKAQDYMLAQQRTRVFLRGMRTCFGMGIVPPPMATFGPRPLVEFLDFSLPSVDWSGLTATMTQNLKDSLEAMKTMLQTGEAKEDDILCFPLDRAEGKVYVRRFSKNIVPTLTTTNKYLFLASLDLSKKETDRRVFRFLNPKERMLLQGFPPNTLDGCHDALKVQASGNAYPVPLMMAVLGPIVKDIKEDLLQPFPAEPLNSPRCVALCHDFECYMDKFASQELLEFLTVMQSQASGQSEEKQTRLLEACLRDFLAGPEIPLNEGTVMARD